MSDVSRAKMNCCILATVCFVRTPVFQIVFSPFSLEFFFLLCSMYSRFVGLGSNRFGQMNVFLDESFRLAYICWRRDVEVQISFDVRTQKMDILT